MIPHEHEGRKYRFAPLTIGDLRALEATAEAASPPLRRAVAAREAGASQALIDRLAEQDAAEMAEGCAFGSARFRRWLDKADGHVDALMQSLRRGSPEYTEEVRTQVVLAIEINPAFKLAGRVLCSTLPEANPTDPSTPPTTTTE